MAAISTNSISSFSTSTIQELILNNAIHSRRLLFHNPLLSSPPPSSDSSLQPRNSNTFVADVVMILSVLLCALICSLALNFIIRCALRCSTFVATDTTSGNGTSPSAHIANTGIRKKALNTFPTISYTTDLNLPGLDTECAICLSDFAPGERVRVLPKCHHGFHIRCIDKWLSSHSSCPSCRNCLIETCEKIVGSTSSRPVAEAPSPRPQEVVIIKIEPLQPECMIRNREI